ncbi:MAG: sporulation protein YunB [Eubacteriales bacterium]
MLCIRKNKKKIMRRILIVILVLLIIVAAFIRWLNKKLDVIVSDIVEEGLKNTITKIINESIYESMAEFSGDSAIIVSYGADGKVLSLTVDSVKVNFLRADVSRRVSEKLDALEKYYVDVDISNALDDVIIFGKSDYCFTADVVPIGGIETDVKSEFVSAGINQTNYRMNMTVDVGITAVMLISTVTVDVSTSVSMAEILIVGEVPGVYWN